MPAFETFKARFKELCSSMAENQLLGIDYGPVSSCDHSTGPNLVHAMDYAHRHRVALSEDQF